MKVKKAFAAALSFLLAATLTVGCGKGSDAASSAMGNSSVTTGGASSGRAKEGIMYKEGLPIVDPGSYSFTLFVDDSQESNDYVMFPILEKETGIKVKLVKYPNAIAKEKLSVALSTGDYPDCIGGWTLTANDILTHGMNEGTYIALDDYFKKYCPKIEEILKIKGVRDTMTTPDGHIYSIPYALEAPYVPFNPFVNTKWLKNVGLKMPTTTEEFRTMLKAFKEKDANGNGNPNDEVPFTSGPDNKNLGLLCGWFGMSVDDEGFTMKDGKLVFGANTNEYKNGIKYLASLYKDGLIDKELFTQDSSQWKAKGSKDLYGVCQMYGSGDIMPYDAGTKPNWEPLPVLSSPECPNPVWLRDTYGTTVLKNQVVVTDKAKNPEIICRWWDNLFQLENTLQSNYGPLGVTLFKEKDGSYKTIDKSKLSEADQKLYDWGHLFPQALPRYTPAGFKVKETVETYDEKGPVDKLYEPHLTDAIPQYWVGPDDASRLADLSTAVKDYITQKKAEWISGQSNIDADWNGYLQQLKTLGVDELVKLRQDALKSNK